MADFQIPVTYFVNATAVTPSAGLEPLKLSTILLLTDEKPANDITGSYIIARNASTVANQWGTETETAAQANVIFAQNPNILNNDGYLIVAPFNNSDSANETLTAAIQRMAGIIYFEGILTTRTVADEEMEQASAAVQAMKNRILMNPQSSTNALTGIFTKTNSFTKNLLYTMGADDDEKARNARLFAADYLSRGLAVNYSGSNTTLTMNLKDLSGLDADTNISETILGQCAEVGADCFVSVEGLPKVVSNPQEGLYFDQVTNQIWLVNSIQAAVFNVLATTRTKIPQTEAGADVITAAIKDVMKQAVTNGYLAPGVWNSSDTFGNQEDFLRNIEEFGYYIWHQPVGEQTQTQRETRKSVPYMVAGKESGAVHSSNVLIYLEA